MSKEEAQNQRAQAQKQKEMREAFLYFRKENVALRNQHKKEYIEHNRKMLDLYMRGEIGPDYDENPPPKRKAAKISMERMLSYGYTKKTGGAHYYHCWVWSVAQREFRQLLSYERQRSGLKTSDKKELFTELAEFYFMYVRLYRVMDEVYDQMAHPQKRMLVRQILDYLILRTMEIKSTLVALENSEFIYFDEIAVENNWTPEETTMDIPRYYFYDQEPAVKEREQWISEFRKKAPTAEVKQEEAAGAGAKKKKEIQRTYSYCWMEFR